MNGKYAAGLTVESRTPHGATGFAGLSNFVPRIFVASEISMISIYHQSPHNSQGSEEEYMTIIRSRIRLTEPMP